MSSTRRASHRSRSVRGRLASAAALAALAASSVLVGCGDESPPAALPALPGLPSAAAEPAPQPPLPPQRGRPITLAFAGDTHFEAHLAGLLEDPDADLGPMGAALADADLAMLNLESAVTTRGTPEAKELEDPDNRYHFRTSPAALDVIARSGVDVVTVANNHGADYGPVGLRDTLAAARSGPLPVIGVGRNRAEAFTPHVATVRGTEVAFLAGDASFREGASDVWAAGPDTPGLADAHEPQPAALLAAVRAASRSADVVVVYLHWGAEGQACPTDLQRATATSLAAAGADVIVGSHAHVLLGSGWSGDTYVSYGLGNFLWYHDGQPTTGVLQLRVAGGEVVSDDWSPGVIEQWGPEPVAGPRRLAEIEAWRALRDCADLAAAPGGPSGPTGYTASVRPIGPALRARMTASHRPGCPVDLADLRHLRVRHLGFDGRVRTGELVVAAAHAEAVVGVFERLYDARWPIERMRLVDEYGGDDDRSMAANNTSAYNCRTVAGSTSWSEHAFGAAIDLNPAQNPYVTQDSVSPPAATRYVDTDRSPGAVLPPGAIGADDVVVRAFAAIGWEWGGTWAEPDFQHFAAPREPSS